jgi:hypothetical protein
MQKLKSLSVYIHLIIFQFGAYAQSTPAQIPIPFRVGDKFGVINSTGNFLIKPQFDWITIADFNQKVLIGYNSKNSIVLSSLIYQNKILLFNQYYKDYYLRNGLFTAVQFRITDEKNPEFSKRFIEREDLFTTDGKKLIEGNFNEIAILNGIDEEGLLDQTLVATTDTAKRESLFIYDRKLKKISERYVTNSNYLKVTNNSEYNYKNKSYTIVFKDTQGIGHQLQIVNNGKSLKLASNKVVAIAPERPRQYDDGPSIEMPDHSKSFKSDSNGVKDNMAQVINTYAIKSRYYYFPKQIEQLQNSISLLNGAVLVIRNEKKGLKDSNTGAMIIPPVYDDILKGEFEGSGGYILRSGKTYKAVYYDIKPIIIPTIFDKVPFVIVDYFGKGHPLIKLYDENGRFFCYADAVGKLYYKEK